MTYDVKNDGIEGKSTENSATDDKSATDKDNDVIGTGKIKAVAKEAILELIEAEDGTMQLRDVNDHQEPLVTIAFSKKVAEMLDGETYAVGQHMIHSAIQMVMHKQISSWHANVYDEEPEHYS